jgi:hypothetical protein
MCRKHIRINNFYAVFMHYLVVYAQNIHVLSDYFSTYIGDILQKTLRTNQKNHGKVYCLKEIS